MDDKLLALKRARLLEARAKEAAATQTKGAAGDGSFFVNQAVDEAKKFGNALLHGRNVGEHMPGGETIANVGSSIGAGAAALTAMPFSDESFSNLYAKYRQPMIEQSEKEKAADEASLSARLVKSGLAGLPVGALKSASVAAPAKETVEAAPGWLSSGSKFSVPAEGGGLFPKTAESAGKGWLAGTSKSASAAAPAEAEAITEMTRAQKMKDWLKNKGMETLVDEGIDMLPYVVRKPIQITRRIMK